MRSAAGSACTGAGFVNRFANPAERFVQFDLVGELRPVLDEMRLVLSVLGVHRQPITAQLKWSQVGDPRPRCPRSVVPVGDVRRQSTRWWCTADHFVAASLASAAPSTSTMGVATNKRATMAAGQSVSTS